VSRKPARRLIGAGGVMTSTGNASGSGQQWDAPNAWAPLQQLLVEGLRATGRPEAAALAERIAKSFLKTALANLLSPQSGPQGPDPMRALQLLKLAAPATASSPRRLLERTRSPLATN
jgi:hypothetical protein